MGIAMTTPDLAGVRIKIDRAKKHFDDLKTEMSAFYARNPYRILRDEESEPATKIYRVQMIEDIPATWSGIIGDTIHNLRSALDSLATNLVVRGGHISNAALKETYFPIRGSLESLSDKDATRFFERVGPNVEKIVRRMQPYRGGRGHPLWQLNQLDIIDKHRRIIAAYGDLRDIQINHLPYPTRPAASLPFNNAPFPLKEGDELLRVTFREQHFDSFTHFFFDVSFNEPEIAPRESVTEKLSQFIDFVQRLIVIFEKRFF
jgi:hypothetical protein